MSDPNEWVNFLNRLSTRPKRAIEITGISSFEELRARFSELRRLPNFGRKSASEIEAWFNAAYDERIRRTGRGKGRKNRCFSEP